MSLFLTADEKDVFTAFRKRNPGGQDLFAALDQRVSSRAASPGIPIGAEHTAWWFCTAEYVSDAAMLFALEPSRDDVSSWLRDVVLSLIRRSDDDWVGPPFRDHRTRPLRGNLETAHLSWGVAVALDLAPEAFADAELREIRKVLRDRAIPMCLRWLDHYHHIANWRCVLTAGVAVPAAVLDDASVLSRAAEEYRLQLNAFQADGSYGESLQYSNYAAYNLMLTREALIRRDPTLEARLTAEPWAKLPRWQAASLLYRKPLSGWGASPRARSVNFNDSSAIFRPSGDLLLHVAARCQESRAVEAGLARWLFDTLYAHDLTQGPHDSATFGFINDWGFLSVPLLPRARTALSPAEAKLPLLNAFSCGDVIVRDTWNGDTVLATHGGGDPLKGPGHLHGDLNSFILVHKRERLLIDPGHSCYRNLIHSLEGSTRTHNTCTFMIGADGGLGLQEDKGDQYQLEQHRSARVFFDRQSREPGKPADRGARRLIAERNDKVSVIGSEAAKLYGQTIQEFSRFWILCGSRALFVVDHIVGNQPIRVGWHWLFNNRDGGLRLSMPEDSQVLASRGGAGLKLFHIGEGKASEPENAYAHDAYHPNPDGLGEGHAGSGKLLTWLEPEPAERRTVIHAIALDNFGAIPEWQLRETSERVSLQSPDGKDEWSISLAPDALSIRIRDAISGAAWSLRGTDQWALSRED